MLLSPDTISSQSDKECKEKSFDLNLWILEGRAKDLSYL